MTSCAIAGPAAIAQIAKAAALKIDILFMFFSHVYRCVSERSDGKRSPSVLSDVCGRLFGQSWSFSRAATMAEGDIR
jgi:hypothetical protein